MSQLFSGTQHNGRGGRRLKPPREVVGRQPVRNQSLFPAEPSATPTDKLIACIDAELEKEAHSA